MDGSNTLQIIHQRIIYWESRIGTPPGIYNINIIGLCALVKLGNQTIYETAAGKKLVALLNWDNN